jgi:hypothetical protein
VNGRIFILGAVALAIAAVGLISNQLGAYLTTAQTAGGGAEPGTLSFPPYVIFALLGIGIVLIIVALLKKTTREAT